jgi:prepilin-type N-terminal cleavage/methylation domain-containing protein
MKHPSARLLSFRTRFLLLRPFGFSIVELLVVVAIISILAGLSIPAFLSVLRRERANAVVLSLYGWLNEIRQVATRVEGEGCQIQFQTGTFAVGQVMAQVSNSSCASLVPAATFVNDGTFSQQRSVQLRSSSPSIAYTPRTLTTNSSDLALTLVVGGDPPVRCLRISAVSGAIEVGKNGSSSVSADCTYGGDKAL